MGTRRLGRAGMSVARIGFGDMKGDGAMNVELDVSLYPLTEEFREHPVRDFVDVLETHGCEVEHTPLSSIVKGESADVFEALRLGYEQAARKSGCVLIVKACNVCSL